jgi:4-diphosphocytidyl-2C-methyl-D-erythritol kinase
MPAAVAVDGRLEDFTHDLSRVWGRTVSLTGSGSGCFAYFGSLDEANDAAESVSDICLVSNGVQLRDRGVARVD